MMVFGLGGAELTILFLVISVLLLPVIALIDVVRNDFQRDNDKIIWVLIILFLPFLGSMAYFFVGVNQKVNRG